MMIASLIIGLALAGLILWATIWITNKAYSRKWENPDED
ncbi:hypothetical protein HMPREF9413_1613 [Paenibacillus sp. HGF7]|nr:hypothetical protein HMPREF9413_1613 [Paenibacillus sp. HGF7]EPD82776.1 hypothetical protein HMPREF1207_03568 [Paenibacillus sp. HGH0039]